MDFIGVLQILPRLRLRKNVVRIDWFPHGKSFHESEFQTNFNVCVEMRLMSFIASVF